MRLTARTALLLTFAVSSAAAQAPVPAINRADIDTTCAPCNDFYKFATGGWASRTQIPAAFATWSSFNELTDRNYVLLRAILDSSAARAKTTKDPGVRKLGYFYSTCMDTVAVEARGDAPIRADLARVDAIRTRADIVAEITRMHRDGRAAAFGTGSGADEKDSRRVILQASQGGLGMPERGYYFNTDSATVAIRKAYREHVARMLRLVGTPAADAESQADKVLALETALATASLSRVQLRDPKLSYHFMSVASADSITPGFYWRNYLTGIGVGADSFNLAHPDFFRALANELQSRPVDDWKAYLRFRTVNNSANTLSSGFRNAAFTYASAVTGAREQQPRWRQCLANADGLLTDLLGREYVKVAYTPAAKAAMDSLISNMMAVYRVRLQALPWMGEATRKEALAKLGTFTRKMGYPATWRDYAAVTIEPTGWYENLRSASMNARRTNLGKVGKPTDRGEWFMSPPTVNAYYNPPNNEIVFPAGRMQPPFFHPSYDVAANYGGIAATIGHEMSHGFDDQGRQYDAAGNLRDWWTSEDASRFGALAAQIEQQYNEYTVLDGLHVNGKLTLGENIADNVGVQIAYEALQRALAGKPRTLIDGFTPEQRFFLGWAQARRGISRDRALRMQVQTDPHSPSEFRVNGPLSNMPEFAAAWGCKKGDRMVRDNPVKIF